MNFFSSRSFTTKLLELQCGEDTEKWSKKAVEYLVKKLKNKKGALRELEKVLTSHSADSPCITIPRIPDGTLDIKYHKTFPHVIYCRVWRWPNLRSAKELQAVENCNYSCEENNLEICINPYHYEKVRYKPPSPVLVPKNLKSSQSCGSLFADEADDLIMPQNVSIERYLPNNYNEADIMHIEYLSDPETFSHHKSENIEQAFNKCSLNDDKNNSKGVPDYTPCVSLTSSYELQNDGLSPDRFSSLPKNIGQSSKGFFSSSQNIEKFPYTYFSPPQNFIVPQYDRYSRNVIPIAYQEPLVWASIAYYELNLRVGEIFHCNAQSIYVDGYTDPSKNSDRFCLGKLSNTMRSSIIENTRKHIGNGVRFYYVGGEVHAECLSDCAIFVQSRSCNYSHGFNLNTVCKIPPKCSLKIFNNVDFAKLLSQSIKEGFAAVYELTKMCTIRMSFVKGWGSEYHRHDVTATPCWIEVHLHGPLQWLDNVLKQIGTPLDRISSVS